MTAVASLSPASFLGAVRTDLGPWKWTDLPAPWVLTLVAIVLFVLARALYASEKAKAPTWARLGLAGLRAAILFLILLVLAGPYREEVITAEERSQLVILLDASASMEVKDRYGAEDLKRLREAAFPEGTEAPPEAATGEDADLSRHAWVTQILAGEGERLLRRLDERFILHVYAFDQDWRSVGSTRDEPGEGPGGAATPTDRVLKLAEAIRALKDPPNGEHTHLGMVLRNVAGEFLGHPDPRLAGVLLVSDGRDTGDGESPLDTLQALGAARKDLHVTAVAVGNLQSGRNARIERIRAKDVVLVDDEVVFETAVRHTGFTGLEGVTVGLEIEKVADAEGRPITPPTRYDPNVPSPEWLETRPFSFGEPDKPQDVRLRAPFNEAGTFKVRAQVRLPAAAKAEDAVKEDDVAEHEIRVVDQRIKVLFVDHGPRHDWRFLSNWLTREADPRAIRRPGEPPPRRRYAAHVLLQTADPTVDLPRSSDLPRLKSFPSTRSQLFDYDVVILGDVDWATLGATREESRKIPDLLAEFVREGGGLALEAGVDYRNPLGFIETALRDLVPVQIHERDEPASERRDVRFGADLTEAGREHPIFAVVPGRDGLPPTPDEVEAWWARPDWSWWWLYRSTGGLKPGAIALAEARPDDPADASFRDDRGRPLVLFSTMGFGRGRVFFSAIDYVAAIRRATRDLIYGAFWDQVVRYLATYRLLGGNKRYKILPDKDAYLVGETATITITALNREFEPLDAEVLEGLHVEGIRGEEIVIDDARKPRSTMEEGGAPGTYRFYLPIRESGTYRLWIETPAEPGVQSDRAEKRIKADFRSSEKRETMPNPELLEEIARETDGRRIRLDELPALVADPSRLPSRTIERVLNRTDRQQWDAPWVLLLLVGLLTLEWISRRRGQMI